MSAPQIHQRPSPHHRARGAARTSVVVLHADASRDVAATLSWLADPASKVSYHFVVGRTGQIYQCVPLWRAAYHAGVSEHPGATVGSSVNNASVGLCFSNAQDGREPFTESALHAGARLVAHIARECPGVVVDGVVQMTTHEACARPKGRKRDPGPLFDMARFAALVREAMQR